MSAYSSAALWTSLTHVGVVTSMLFRNIIFARFLTTEDFAVALTFGIVLSLFEYISNFGHENLMQRSDHGDELTFQATMHSAMILRGALVAATIYLVAPYIPDILNTTQTDFDYRFLAVLPIINGLTHLDHQRLHRQQNYTLTAKLSLSSDALSIVIAILAVSIWHNHWAFYTSLVARHVISLLLSHLWAKREYRLAFETTHIKSLIAFGAPLLLVGVLKYIALEADKAIIANTSGLNVFAAYVLTVMFVVNGTNVVNLALSKIFIRRVSTANGAIQRVIKSNGIIHCYLIFPLIFMLCMFGEDILTLIFQHQYTPVPFLILAVSGVVIIRSLNQWLNQTVIASTSTKLILKAEITRVISALLGISLIYPSNNVLYIILAFGLAELIYFISLTLLVNKKLQISQTSSALLCLYLSCACVFASVFLYTYDKTFEAKLTFSLIALFVFSSAFISFSTTCRKQTVAIVLLVFNTAKNTRKNSA